MFSLPRTPAGVPGRFLPLFAVLLLCLSPNAGAETTAEPDAPSVEAFLAPDGSFDLERARRAGFEGELDLGGYRGRLDREQRPVFEPVADSGLRATPDDNWWDGFGCDGGTTGLGHGDVYALAVYQGLLYVGGLFDTAGGVSAAYIASWDGCAWRPLGSGLNNNPHDLAAYGGYLYAVGNFTQAGGNSVGYMARWNGSSWSSVGSGLNGVGKNLTVYADPVHGSVLITVGGFTQAGGVSASYVARWNGSSWSAVGSGTNDFVRTIVADGSDLYVGGDFTQAGGGSANYVARWNGTSWSALGTGMNQWVYELALPVGLRAGPLRRRPDRGRRLHDRGGHLRQPHRPLERQLLELPGHGLQRRRLRAAGL
jgi:hypothetical protein